MKFQTLGNARQFGSAMVKNVGTISVPRGAPIYYKHDTTGKPGLDVLSAEGLSAINQRFFAGIAMTEIPANGFGDAFCYGFYDEVRVFQRSRSGSTESWPTAAAIAVGEYLSVLTAAQTTNATWSAIFQLFQGLGTAASVTGASSATDATAAILLPEHLINWVIRAAESFSSTPGIATGTADPQSNQLVSYVNLRCLIRAL